MWPNPQFPADLVTFTEEIVNGDLHFLCSVTVLIFRLPVFSQYPRMHWSDRMRENTNQKKTPYSDTFYLVCIFYTVYDIYYVTLSEFSIFIFLVADRWYTTGISTYSTGCGRPNKYGMYTNVASFRSWIIEHIIDYSEPFWWKRVIVMEVEVLKI